MAEYPVRGQAAPNYWDLMLKAYIDEGDTSTALTREELALADYAALMPFWARLATRTARLVNIGQLGPSITEGAFVASFDRTPSQLLARTLRARYPTPGVTGGGRGYIGVPSTAMTGSGNYTPGMWPLAFTGGTIDPVDPAASVFDLGAKHAVWYANGSGKVVDTLANPVTSFDIRHIAGPAGSVNGGYYKIDGGASVPVDTFAATAVERITHVALPASSTIEVGWGGTGYIIFDGIVEYAGDENAGLQVHNFGHSGFKCSDFAADPTVDGSWRTAIASFNLDLLILSDLGINDASNGVTSSQFKTALMALIAVLRAGSISCPIVLAANYDVTSAPGVVLASPWPQYVTAMREIADADATIVFVDHSARMPATAAASTYGLYHADKIHPAAGGGANQYMQETVAVAIAPR